MKPVAANISTGTLLGGVAVLSQLPGSALEWVNMIRRGISSGAVDSMLKSIGLSQAELASALAIPERTLARRKREGILSSEESAKLLRLARIVVRATQVFEDLTIATHWLKSPAPAFGGMTPLSLVDTDIGADSVLDTLGRIEQGVFF